MSDDPLKPTPWCELDRDNWLIKRRRLVWYPSPHWVRRRVRYANYDQWKLASPDDGWHPRCSGCDDYGCPLCCETQPIVEDDLAMMGAPDGESQ
jgi:hypothetical protein